MEIALAPESAARIRAVLGDTVDLSPAGVPQALAQLAGEAPDVYSEVLDQLSGSDIRLDSERVLHRRHKRTALRRALFGWGEYDSDVGDRLLAKRRVAAALPIGLAAVMLAAAGCSALLNTSHRASPPPASVRVLRSSQGPSRGEMTAIRRAVAREAPLRPGSVAGRTAMAAAPEPVRASPQLPPVPALTLPSLLPGRDADRPLPPSIVFSRVPSSSGGPAHAGDTAPHSPVVYARDAAGDVGESPAPPPSASGDTDGPRTGMPRKPGVRIAARLVTGVVVAAGVPPVPVVAEGTDGSTWLGHAVAEPDGRVHISFQAADQDINGSRGGRPTVGGAPVLATVPASGVALEPDQLSVGLPGRLVIRRRAAAAAAIGAVVQAASDYLQALAHAGQVTVAAGTTQVSVGGPAPGWTYAASRLADTLNPQASGTTIETLEIPAGTRCIILITEAR